MLEKWQHIYSTFNPIAISIGPFSIYWYGIMYVTALLGAYFVAKWYVKKENFPIQSTMLDNYFLYAELGVILGARIGYVLVYDPNTSYYLSHPWQIFNPFADGEFTGIRGMSYHGGLVGFLVATWLFSRKNKYSIWKLLDLTAVSIPLAYVFGRIGNFLNQELIGRVTDLPWGIYVDGVLRHPSQLYEAILEGLLVFIIVYTYRKRQKYDGELIVIYGIFYSLGRFIAEFWREPDLQIGYILGWMTTGQLLSLITILVGIYLFIFLKNLNKKRKKAKI